MNNLLFNTPIFDRDKNQLIPKLHLPIMETIGMITSVWNTAIVFRPRAGALAVLMITKQFDKNFHFEEKKKTEQMHLWETVLFYRVLGI